MGLGQEEELQGPTPVLIGQCPQVEVVMGGVKMNGLLDTGSQISMMRHSLFTQHFPDCNVKDPPAMVKLKAANNLLIPYLGYVMMDFVIEGHHIEPRGVFIVKDDSSSSPLIIGMNVITACWDAVFCNTEGSVSFSCQSPKSRNAWRTAFATCRRTVVATEDGFRGHIRPAHYRGVTIPARSEMVVWGRVAPGVRDYYGLVEALPEPGAISVARTVSVVRHGRVPVRVRNLQDFPVSLGRYEKLGRLFQVDDVNIHGARDVSLQQDAEGVVEVSVVDVCDAAEEDSTRDVLKLADRPDLTPDEQSQLGALLRRWEKAFSAHEEDFGRTNVVKHAIPTGDAAPIRERFRPLPPLLYQDMRVLLAGMLQSGVITESSSPWAAPIVMVRKKDGTWRFCVDYRKLNAVTHKDAFPLPRIEETLTSMTRAEWFSTLDLASGYWQVEVDPQDREKTAFTTPLGLYEFQRMPFGLCNAPATFQRLMQQCLSGQITDSLLVYLDDIIVYSPDFATHVQHLEEVFERLWRHGLKLRPDKCKLFHREVKFLGHVVDQRGVRPDPEKISAVVDWPVPTTAKELKAFLGLAGYYRRFVSGFAKVARPLNSLLVGIPNDKRLSSRPLSWSSEAQSAFDSLKRILTEAPILAYADFTQPFVLYTDASHYGLGAVLAQVQEGRERVVAYASRSLHPTERNDANYSSFKLELLALKWAITEKFKDYLTGATFTVYTDNNPVAHLQSARLGAVEQRWVAQLASFNFEVKYRAGRENVNADALSRFPISRTPPEQATGHTVVTSAAVGQGEDLPAERIDWVAEQQTDPDLRVVKRYVEQGSPPARTEQRMLAAGVIQLLKQFKRLCIREGVLCRRFMDSNSHEQLFQIVCPGSKRQEVWRRHHEAAAHAGTGRTLTTLRRRFFWVGMEQEVRGLQSKCVVCSLQKDRAEPRAPLNPVTVTYPLEVVALDFLSLGRPSDSYQNILVMTDMFTRYSWAVPTRDQTAKTTVRAIWAHIIQTFGCPGRFHSDQGPNFESDLMKQLCDMYRVAKSRTTPYHPAGNGRVERMNQTLLGMLRTLGAEKQSRWPEYLPELLQAYNNTVHSSTGFAPSYLMFGRHLRLPVDVGMGVVQEQPRGGLVGWVQDHHRKLTYAYGLARDKMARTAERSKRHYDQRANATPLLTGERVWVRNRNRQGQGKLHGGWDPDPHLILEAVGGTGLVYRVRPEGGGRERVLHRNSLKLCTGPVLQTRPQAPPVTTELCTNVPMLYCAPAVDMPAPIEEESGVAMPAPVEEEPGVALPAPMEEEPVRRPVRVNRGVPPRRYRH